MEYEINCKNKPRKYFMLALMPHILKQLNLQNSKANIYIVVEKMENDGLAINVGTGYVIALNIGRSVMDTAVTLCHELVHIKQMITGKLGNDNSWCGKPCAHLPYMKQPWELQAFAKQEILFRNAFEKI